MDESSPTIAASELTWHSDAAYTPHPFDAISLHAIDVVDDASSTFFVSAEQAARELPSELRNALVGREQEMIAPHYMALADEFVAVIGAYGLEQVLQIVGTEPGIHIGDLGFQFGFVTFG